jgi:single-strand DNA-binding protein
MNRNRVELAGNLTRDPVLRFTQSGVAVAEFGMAVNERFKSGEEIKERVTFVDVTCWGKRAEALVKHFKKGKNIFVDGRLTLESWVDRDTQQKRHKLAVTCESWEFIGPPRQGEAGAADSDETPDFQ